MIYLPFTQARLISTPRLMTQYVLNSTSRVFLLRREFDDDQVRLLSPLLQSGYHQLSGGDYQCLTGRGCQGEFMATFYGPRRRPCLTMAVAHDAPSAGQLWPMVQQHYRQLTDLPGVGGVDWRCTAPPYTTPWCAVVLILPSLRDVLQLADVVRCMAWARLEEL